MSICPKGMWVTEPQALQRLGMSSGEQLKEALKTGSLPHVLVERGSSVKSATPPYTQHRFFFITTEGQSAQANLSLKLMQWIMVCKALGDSGGDMSEMEPRDLGLLAKYAGKPSVDPNSFGELVTELKEAQAVILPDDLKQLPATDGEPAANAASLDSLLSNAGAPRHVGDSATVSGPITSNAQKHEEGEIYIRADGKKVRRVKKKPAGAAASSSQSVAPAPASSLSSHLGAGPAKGPGGDSATVPGDMGKSQPQEEGEIYIRADGKKVRRVKKKKPADAASVAPQSTSLGSMLANDAGGPKIAGDSATVPGNMGMSKPAAEEEGEIYIRADGKKVRRVKKKPVGDSASVSAAPAEEGEIYIRADGKKVRRVKKKPGLDGLLDSNQNKPAAGSGSATVTGAETGGLKEEGEIYIRADGKKVRRIKKTRSVSGNGLNTFLGNNPAQGPQGGSATVSGDGKELGEIYIRADGKKVRRVKKAPQAATNSQSLQGFLGTGAPGTGFSGSATVTGAEGAKATYAEGEIYIRPDGKKVRRIKKTAKTEEEKQAEEEAKKAEEEAKTDDAAEGEAKTDDAAEGEAKTEEAASAAPNASAAGDLAGFLDNAADQKPKMSGSATVAGDMVARSAQPDDEVEIITRPDGTKVRRIRRRVPAGGAMADGSNQQEGEIITRPDGTKVRRIVRTSVTGAETAGDLAMAADGSEPLDATPAEANADQPEGATQEATPEAATSAETASDVPPAQEQAPPEQQSDPAPEAATSEAQNGDHAYIVVVGDEGKANGSKLEAAPDSNGASDPTVGPDGEQRFAVKVGPNEGNEPQQLKVESDVRYLTLDELANLSGQSKEDLNDVVKQKMNLDSATPRFVLSSMDKEKAPEVAPAATPTTAAAAPEAAPSAAAASAPAQRPPASGNRSFIPDGMQAVPDDVAEAARAVTAMGATDIAALMEKLNQGDVGEILKKLRDAEKRQKKLEKQLAQAGVAIADDIPYDEAKEKVEEIAKRMNEIGGSDVTHPDKDEQIKLREEYFKLEQEMERYNSALMITEEYQAEQDRIEKKWEDDNLQANIEALKQMRRHMPVNIRNLSEAALTGTPSPNGKFLPKLTAKKFKRTNVLMLIRLSPDDIERMHPSTLENMRVTGLTLTERRALYAHLQPIGPKWNKNKAEKMTERKWTWYNMMKNNFKESLAPYQRHIAQYGPPDNHPYATRDDPTAGCPLLGKQCPVKADKNPDYTGDYGWTDKPEYEKSNVTKSDVDDPGAKAMAEALELAKEKKANERGVALKKHYKGVMFVSKANGSCEQMDESMDKMEQSQAKWIENALQNDKFSDDDKKKEIASFNSALNDLKLAVLDFAGRSGMQTSGKKKAGGDGPDTRAAVECALSEEVIETSEVFFKYIHDRMEELKVKDTRVTKTIELLEGMFSDLHGKNIGTLKKLGVPRPDRSRKLKKTEDVKEEVAKRLVPDVTEPDEAFGITDEVAPVPPAARPPRGGLLDGIKGRGRGGGRGGLMDAIAGRGAKPAGGGGRGGLMDAIAGRGRGPPGGGRGGLMDAIAGRGKAGGGGDGGGRGGLMAAIAGRGAKPAGGGGGGRGGLMAAIAARGGG